MSRMTCALRPTRSILVAIRMSASPASMYFSARWMPGRLLYRTPDTPGSSQTAMTRAPTWEASISPPSRCPSSDVPSSCSSVETRV